MKELKWAIYCEHSFSFYINIKEHEKGEKSEIIEDWVMWHEWGSQHSMTHWLGLRQRLRRFQPTVCSEYSITQFG